MSDVPTWGGQPIPYSQEAEEATIGAILVNPVAYYGVAAFLAADDFFILRHKYIWQAFTRLEERNSPIDYVTVTQALREMDKLGEIGGPAYLTQLINATPTSVHAEVYGQLVERAAVRRRMMAAADEIKALAINEELTVEQAVDEGGKKYVEATQLTSGAPIITFREAVSAYFAKVDYLVTHEEALTGLPTGFEELDRILGGLQKTDLLLLGGRPGMGKSALLLSIVLNQFGINPQARVAYQSLEMGMEQLVQRAAAMEAGINLQALRSGGLTTSFNGEWSKFVAATGKISEYNLFIDDRPAQTPQQLEGRLHKLLMEGGALDLVVVDYVQLMTGGVFSPEKRVQEVGYISRSLKNMAKTFNAPILAAASLSRAVEQRADKRPVLSDLRESGDLESDADVVMFIYRDEVYHEDTQYPNQGDVIVAKHRNGPTGTATLHFEKTLTKWANAATRSIDFRYWNEPAHPVRAITPRDTTEKPE